MSECGAARARRRRPAESTLSGEGTAESEEGPGLPSQGQPRGSLRSKQSLRTRHLDGSTPEIPPFEGHTPQGGPGRTRAPRGRDPKDPSARGSKRGAPLRPKRGPRGGPHATVLEEEGDLSKLVLAVRAHLEKLPLGVVVGGAVAAAGAVGGSCSCSSDPSGGENPRPCHWYSHRCHIQ